MHSESSEQLRDFSSDLPTDPVAPDGSSGESMQPATASEAATDAPQAITAIEDPADATAGLPAGLLLAPLPTDATRHFDHPPRPSSIDTSRITNPTTNIPETLTNCDRLFDSVAPLDFTNTPATDLGLVEDLQLPNDANAQWNLGPDWSTNPLSLGWLTQPLATADTGSLAVGGTDWSILSPPMADTGPLAAGGVHWPMLPLPMAEAGHLAPEGDGGHSLPGMHSGAESQPGNGKSVCAHWRTTR